MSTGIGIGIGIGLEFGGGGSDNVPAWVMRSGGIAADYMYDYTNNRVWSGGLQRTVSSSLSCSRALSAYYTNTSGVLTPFSSDQIRFGDLGLLWEEARTNICLRSEDISNTAWNKNNALVTVDQIASPDGTTTADTIGNTAAGSNFYYVYQGINMVNGTTYARSNFVKNKTGSGRTWLYIGSVGFCYFNVAAGTIEQSSGWINPSIAALTSGWYRCVAAGLKSTADASDPAGLGMYSVAGTPNFDPGVANSQELYGWGSQLEVGSFATSYIPTVATSVTRPADIITGLPNPASSITDYLDLGIVQGNAVLLGAGNDTILIKLSSSNQVQATDGTTTITATAGSGFVSAGKVVVRRNGTSIGLCLNGGTVATGTLAAGNFGQCQYGKAANTSVIGTALVKAHARWEIALSDAALQSLSSP